MLKFRLVKEKKRLKFGQLIKLGDSRFYSVFGLLALVDAKVLLSSARVLRLV